MNTKIFEVKCITNLHIGTSGSAYGVIKNEVEKDVVLNTPLLPASGIKGALRDFWRQNNKDYQNWLEFPTFIDIIDNYIENHSDATTNSLINAVLHYWDHDDFLD